MCAPGPQKLRGLRDFTGPEQDHAAKGARGMPEVALRIGPSALASSSRRRVTAPPPIESARRDGAFHGRGGDSRHALDRQAGPERRQKIARKAASAKWRGEEEELAE
jgi:hypothetical protein